MQNLKNPLRDAFKEENGYRLVRGNSWMSQAQQSIQHACGLTQPKQVKDGKKSGWAQALLRDSAAGQ